MSAPIETQDAADGNFHEVAVGKAGAAQRKTWLGYLWDTADLAQDERKLLFKIDASLLIFASLGYFLKNLDQTNINSAFLSGMKEDLNMYGNELVTATSIWTVGYVIGQIPSNLILTRVSPRFVIPALEVGWGIATLGTYAVKDVRSLYALRFLVGLFESGFYPGIHFLLGSFYTPRELTKRSTIFWVSGSLGTMFSGFLQTAAYTNMNGVHGLEGWRWLFIIDAIITLPIAVLGFFFLPDLPWTAKPSYIWNQTEIDLAVARLDAIGRKGPEPWTKAKVRKLFSNWHVYVLPILYVLWNNSFPQQPMGYWLKSFNTAAIAATPTTPAVPANIVWTVSQINLLPLPATAIFVVMALIFAWTSDGPLRGKRYPLIYVGAVITIIIAAILHQLPVYGHDKAHFALYYLIQSGAGAGPMILNWISEICSNDTEKRAILVAMGNDFAYVVQAVAPNFIWKTVDFPRAQKGFTWVLVLSTLLILWTTLILILLRRDRHNEQKHQQLQEEEAPSTPDSSSDGEKRSGDVFADPPREDLVQRALVKELV